MFTIKIIIPRSDWPLVLEWLETNIELGVDTDKKLNKRQPSRLVGQTYQWMLLGYNRTIDNIVANYRIKDEIHALHFKLRFG